MATGLWDFKSGSHCRWEFYQGIGVAYVKPAPGKKCADGSWKTYGFS